VTKFRTASYHSTINQTAINLRFGGKERERELVEKLPPRPTATIVTTAEELEAG
jgi:hypothetical protein